MAASPDHREAFAELLALWRSDALGEAAGDIPLRRAPRQARWIGWASGLAAVAAALLVVVAAPLRQDQLFETTRGHGQAVRLADGSQVQLSGAARLQVRQGLFWRHASLEAGEAFFDVRHERNRPFEVAVGDARVRVLGTAFDIDRQASGRSEFAVYRGAVRLTSAGGASARLVRGERAAVEAGAIVRLSRPAGDAPDWLSGWFEASDTTLGQLLEEIGRFADRPVVTNQATLADRRISGRFHVAEPTAALAAASLAYGLTVTPEPDRILVHVAR
jgi:transmembrane sensor